MFFEYAIENRNIPSENILTLCISLKLKLVFCLSQTHAYTCRNSFESLFDFEKRDATNLSQVLLAIQTAHMRFHKMSHTLRSLA